MVGRADYNEWGEITYREALDITSSYRRIWPQSSYTGHDWDDVLGMYYAKARFYSAEDKRFVAMDPVKGQIVEPLSLVAYVYCVDNPLRWVDPLGLRLEAPDPFGGAVRDAQALPWGTELVAKQGNLKLYGNYSPSSKVLATIPSGGSVFSQNEAKENAKTTWYKVSYRGQIGWVDASYFKEKASNGTLTQNPAVQNKNQGRVPNTDPDPEPGPPKDAIPPYTKTTDFLFDNPYEYWDEASERAFSCASGCGWHTFAEHRAAGTPWAVWDRTLQENVASRLGQINNIYTDSALESGILYEQMIKTQQTGGQILDTAIENRRSELQTLPVEEVLQLLYLGLMYDEAQKMQDRLFPIYNGIGYAQGIVAPLYEQFPDYMDAAHIAMQGFSIGFHWGLNVALMQAAAQDYYNQLICHWAQLGTVNPAKGNSFSVVLGRYNQDGICYVNVANEQHATYFTLDNYNSLLKKYGSEFMWAINKQFLEQQLAMGKTFILSHNPYTAEGSFGREVQFLIDHGFSFIQSGNLWIAVR